jgi:hypothetical protein
MANYREATAEGTSWRRAKQVAIYNPLEANAVKDILFFEEDVATIGDRVFHTDSGIIKIAYNPDGVIELMNPETNLPTGKTILQKEVYQALFSLYLAAAEARDAPSIMQLTPPNPTGLT